MPSVYIVPTFLKILHRIAVYTTTAVAALEHVGIILVFLGIYCKAKNAALASCNISIFFLVLSFPAFIFSCDHELDGKNQLIWVESIYRLTVVVVLS